MFTSQFHVQCMLYWLCGNASSSKLISCLSVSSRDSIQCFFKSFHGSWACLCFLVSWKPILSLLVQLWQKNNAYVTVSVMCLHMHVSRFAVYTLHIHKEQPSPKASKANVQRGNTNIHAGTSMNFKSFSTALPFLLVHWFLINGKKWRKNVKPCAALATLTDSSDKEIPC